MDQIDNNIICAAMTQETHDLHTHLTHKTGTSFSSSGSPDSQLDLLFGLHARVNAIFCNAILHSNVDKCGCLYK